MHVRLLAGYPADALDRAALIASMVLKLMAGARPEADVPLRELLDGPLPCGKVEMLADARWIDQRATATRQFLGQVCEQFDDDGRRASEIATRLALASGLVSESEVVSCQNTASWEAAAPDASALLRLDRATHRKAFDDLLVMRRRVLIFLVHGEIGQGHEHFAEITTWRLRSGSERRWREIAVEWPSPSRSLGTRLAMLFEELANAVGAELKPPSDDPATVEGARAWTPALTPILDAIDASRDQLFLRHTLRWPWTGVGGDDVLVGAYARAIWASVALRAGERVVVGLDLRRIERGGVPLGKAWRTSRSEFAAARAIAMVLDQLHMPRRGLCLTLPELVSVPATDLVEWLRTEGGRRRDAAELEADQLVSSTRGGRFDLVVQRLTALNLDRHRNTKP
jgi:hypothetical protein